MYLNVYLKALRSGINSYFEKWDKLKSIVGTLVSVAALFLAFKFIDLLNPIKPYYPQTIIAAAFLVLFLGGYKAWLQLYLKEEERDKKVVLVEQGLSKLYIGGYKNKRKLTKMKIDLNYSITNKKEHPISVISIDIKPVLSGWGIPKKNNTLSSDPVKFPFTIEKHIVQEVKFTFEFDVQDMTFEDQMKLIKHIEISPTKDSIATIKDIDGKGTLLIPTSIETRSLLRNMIGHLEYGFDDQLIRSTLSEMSQNR